MSPILDQSAALPATYFLGGIYMATFAASGLFFFKYWRRTQQKFFLYFGLACCILAAERLLFLRYDYRSEANSWLYLLRCSSFLLIIRAVISANARR